jgi:hypothetical protein
MSDQKIPNILPAEEALFPAEPGWLRPNLEYALEKFREGGNYNDGGRHGMIVALDCALIAVGAQITGSEKHLVEPLMCLTTALRDLEKGALHPALIPKFKGRPPARQDVLWFKARCLAATDVLHGSNLSGCGMSRADADREIFKRMREIAPLFGIDMSRKSLQTWRRAARQAFGQDDKPRNMFGCFVWAMKQISSDETFGNYTVTEKIEFILAPVSDEHVRHLRASNP